MLLRLSLVVAILAGAGALYFAHFNVQETITTLDNDLTQSRASERRALDAEQEAKQQAEQARMELAETTRTLNQTMAQYEELGQRLNEQERRANQLADNLSNTTRERNDAQRELAMWRAFEMTPDQIRDRLARFSRINQEREAYAEENQILVRRVNSLENRLNWYEGDAGVELPEGLKGQIVAVDPKYDFVVLDIGRAHGVEENGTMLVNRNGRLIAKIQITRVTADRSVANVLPQWKQEGVEIMEGDQVIH